MPKAKKVESEELDTKQQLVNLIKLRAPGLFDAEPRAGMSNSQIEKLAEEILNLL